VRHVTRIGQKSVAYRVFIEIPDGKTPLGRPRPRWDEDIKMHLQ
jgi:hypothetical protein